MSNLSYMRQIEYNQFIFSTIATTIGQGSLSDSILSTPYIVIKAAIKEWMSNLSYMHQTE